HGRPLRSGGAGAWPGGEGAGRETSGQPPMPQRSQRSTAGAPARISAIHTVRARSTFRRKSNGDGRENRSIVAPSRRSRASAPDERRDFPEPGAGALPSRTEPGESSGPSLTWRVPGLQDGRRVHSHASPYRGTAGPSRTRERRTPGTWSRPLSGFYAPPEKIGRAHV